MRGNRWLGLACADVRSQHFPGHGVVIGEEIECLSFVLKLDCWEHGAEVVTDVEFATGLKACENTHVHGLKNSG